MLSPCKQICQIENNLCVGCNRTLYEIAIWSRATDEQRQSIMDTLHEPDRVERGLTLPNPKRTPRK
jgi:predicted Fe-S protein YdhL (DUF1289 family)